jgi:outer membrane protein assembly factor BamB
VLQALDLSNGSLVWSHDLVKEFNAATPHFGFSSSPLVHEDTLIVGAGGAGTGLLAFKLSDGSLLWKKYDFGGEENGDIYSSPIIINVGGSDQVVLLTGKEVMGIDPKTGERIWGHPLVNQWKTNIGTPIWGSDGILYISSGGEAGSKGLRLTKDGAGTKVEELWATRKMAVGQGTCVRHGGMVYGSSGDTPAFITALNVTDGKLGWRERGFSKAMVVHADNKLIILDEDGNLALATPTSEALTIHSKVQLLKQPAWTAPTIVGKTLYVRDKESIMALDLSKDQGQG